MKIGFENRFKGVPQTYSHHLAELLRRHAPQHEYVVEKQTINDLDIYHGADMSIPLWVWIRGVRYVVTVPSLNFLHHPQMYTFFDRAVRLRIYRYTCRSADCVITMSRHAKEELVGRLGVDERKIKVMMPLGVHLPHPQYDQSQSEAIRRKYYLPSEYVLMLGMVEPRHNQIEVVDAILQMKSDIGLVICGRHTRYSDFLLRYVRGVHQAMRVELIYEPQLADLPALFSMAKAFVYIPQPEAEASLLPIVEALRAQIPMVLSDTPLHREVAVDAALYVPCGDEARLATAVRCVVEDKDLRQELSDAASRRAEVFSEEAVVQRLIDIYSSL